VLCHRLWTSAVTTKGRRDEDARATEFARTSRPMNADVARAVSVVGMARARVCVWDIAIAPGTRRRADRLVDGGRAWSRVDDPTVTTFQIFVYGFLFFFFFRGA